MASARNNQPVYMGRDITDYPLRIGVVSFLNMFPFYCGLAERAPKWSVIAAPPAQLLEYMISGICDVSMIPAFGYLMNRDRFGKLPGTCIGARGPAESVFVLSDVSLDEAEVLELDSRSRTSNALAEILLRGYWGRGDLPVCPEPLPIDENRRARTCVRIGDRAMRQRPQYAHCWDLGGEWNRWQNLPFVFAVWATRGEGPWDELGEYLIGVLDKNLGAIEDLLIDHPDVLPEGISVAAAKKYLTQSLCYELGDQELRGLERYAELIDYYDIGSRRVSGS